MHCFKYKKSENCAIYFIHVSIAVYFRCVNFIKLCNVENEINEEIVLKDYKDI